MNLRAAGLLIVLASAAHAQQLRLPFDGRWFVVQGGDTPNVNQHMTERAQWFGLDFAKVGYPDQRGLSRPRPTKLADFYSIGGACAGAGGRRSRETSSTHFPITPWA